MQGQVNQDYNFKYDPVLYRKSVSLVHDCHNVLVISCSVKQPDREFLQ